MGDNVCHEDIFKKLSKKDFLEDPTRILPLMLDYGVDSKLVTMLEVVMVADAKEVKQYYECGPFERCNVAKSIANYCYVSETALRNVLEDIRLGYISTQIPKKIVRNYYYGEHRISDDGIARYSLDLECLYHVENTTSFDVPSFVRIICDGAFENCTSLEEVSIPSSVVEIQYHAFRNCISLREIRLPNSVTGILWTTFTGCSSLKRIYVPSSITGITDYFEDCTSISFEVDHNNRHYASKFGALFDKSMKKLFVGRSLVRNGCCIIPSSVTVIGSYAFNKCTDLKKIIIPDSVNVIGDNAFNDCSSLNEVRIPDSVTVIGRCAFKGCTNLKKITIPNSVTEIGEWAFDDCKSLCEIYIPCSVKKIKSITNSRTITIVVDDSNRYYASWKGALLDKEMNRLITGNPLLFDCFCAVPNSVADIDWDAFVHNDYFNDTDNSNLKVLSPIDVGSYRLLILLEVDEF